MHSWLRRVFNYGGEERAADRAPARRVAEIGFSMSMMGLADSVCFPAVGVLSDRYGRKFTGKGAKRKRAPA